MAIKPEISEVKTNETKRQVYPEVSNRLKSTVFWLGLAFVIAVFFINNVSGYS